MWEEIGLKGNGNYLIPVTKKTLSALGDEEAYEIEMEPTQTLSRINHDSPYSKEQPIRKIDGIETIPIQAGFCGHCCVAMLSGVPLSDVVALMGKGHASWSKILEELDYYGISYASKAVYPKGSPYRLPPCCIVNNDNGFILWYKGSFCAILRPYILTEQQFHRIYYYVTLDQVRNADKRMMFIHGNLLFSDWWHTDQIISYVADLDFDVALSYAKEYIHGSDPFIRRWGYVLFISRLCKGHAEQLLPLMHDNEAYYVQMAQAWLIAELAIHEPEAVYEWFRQNDLKYNINGKAIQKICDSFRTSKEWKQKYKDLRPELRKRK